MEEQIKANAAMVIQEIGPLSGIDFGYTQESVEWLEGYIERMRNTGQFGDDETRTRLISVFGSYLGECIVRCHGGRWQPHQTEVWGVVFNNNDMAFPFNKVAKQIDNGLADGIGSFFRVIPTVFANLEPAEPSTPKKPWWKFWED